MAVGLSAGPAFGEIIVQEDPIMLWDLGRITAGIGDELLKELIFKEDKDDDGIVGSADVAIYLASAPMELKEQIEIGPGSPPWTDWHEEILTPNWKWGSVNFSAPGLTGLTSNVGGNVADFFFDALYPGTVIDIRKEMWYTGTNPQQDLFPSFGGPPQPGAVKIMVLEYPTPEPATMSMLAFGALAVLRRRRRG